MTKESLNDCLEEIDKFLEAIRDGAYGVTDGVMNTASEHLHELRTARGDTPVVKPSDTLNLCPFCGGEGIIDKDTWCTITCLSCDARTRAFPTIQSATDAWNKRIAPSEIPMISEQALTIALNRDRFRAIEADCTWDVADIMAIVHPYLKREYGDLWIKFPENKPKLYDGVDVSYPLLFHAKIHGNRGKSANMVYQGHYNFADDIFHVAGKDLSYRDEVISFMHYPLPKIEGQS